MPMPRYDDEEDDDRPRRRRSRDDDEYDDDRPLRRKGSVQVPGILLGLAITNTVWGGLFLLTCLGSVMQAVQLLNMANQFNQIFGGAGAPFGNPFAPSRGHAIAMLLFYLLLLALAGGTLAAAIGMLNHKAWSKPAIIVATSAAFAVAALGFLVDLASAHQGNALNLFGNGLSSGFILIALLSVGAFIFNLVVLSNPRVTRHLS
jgi:hypothetical protein